MKVPRWTAQVTCLSLLLTSWPAWSAPLAPSPGHVKIVKVPPVADADIELPRQIDDDPEILRAQLVRLLDEIEQVSERALAMSSGTPAPYVSNAATQSDTIAVHLNQVNFKFDRARADVLALDDAGLDAIREQLEQFPDLLVVPLQLEAVLGGSGQSQTMGQTAEECPGGENTDEVIFITKLVKNSLEVILHPVEQFAEAAASSPGDPTHITAIGAIPLFIAKLVIQLLVDAAELTITIAERVKENRDECLNGLCKPDVDPLGPGKGCDGVDTDCDVPDSIDETEEDQYAPTITIDRNVTDVCYPSVAAATAAVERYTRATDDCSVVDVEEPSTELAGCELFALVAARDTANNVGNDSVKLAVDGTPPTVSCAVATPFLAPADNSMRDVGLTLQATDNCGGVPDIRLEVTSDEPTATAISGIDHAPDAVILYDADNRPNGLLLRAQRNGAVGSNGGGRVYRVRVIATDTCGLESQADCLVLVGLAPNSSTAVNSGQIFDATTVN